MSIITLIAACKWSVMTTIVLLVVALFIGLDQPYVDEKTGKISKRFPDHWIRFQAIMSGVLFGGMVIAEGFGGLLSLCGSDGAAAIFFTALMIAFVAIGFSAFVDVFTKQVSKVKGQRMVWTIRKAAKSFRY